MSRRKLLWKHRGKRAGGMPDIPTRVVRGTGTTRMIQDECGERGKGHICTQPMGSRMRGLVEKWTSR